jgi:hypothetical protein
MPPACPLPACCPPGLRPLFHRVVKQLGLKTRKLAQPRKVKNVDRTLNQSGEIMDMVTLLVKHNGRPM